jgi:DNA-binding response OmpR family regulator
VEKLNAVSLVNEPAHFRLVESILAKQGFNVYSVHDEKECLKLLMQKNPNLIIIDDLASQISMWDLYIEIKIQNKDSKVIFISEIPISKERKEDLYKSGVAGYLQKPINPEELTSLITILYPDHSVK